MNAAASSTAALRAEGAQVFETNGLPNKRLEAWKYTPLRSMETIVNTPHSISPVLSGDHQATGLEVLPMEEALEANAPGLQDLLAALEMRHPALAFSALNNANLEGGLYIRVPAGIDAGRLEWQWHSDEQVGLSHSRICIVLEAGSRLEIFERFEGGLQGALNLVIQVDLGEGATLAHARLQTGSPAAALVLRIEVRQAGGSSFRHTGLDLDGALVRNDLRVRLQGPGASCSLNGAYLPSGSSHIDNHLEVEHQAPACDSSQFYRGVLDGQGRAVWNGRVHVHPGADGTEARQSNANLLLSDHAEVDTKPELEIEADEVVASHGATVGQLDEDAVFYLRSRGLDENQARQLLTGAFCQSVIDGMRAGPSRDALSAALKSALGGTA